MGNEKKLSETTKWLMLGVAIFFDVLQWILVFVLMDWLVVWIAAPTFFLWFLMVGQRLSIKRTLALGGGGLIEAIPILSTFPTWTGVILYLTRVEKIMGKVAEVVPGGKEIASVAVGSGKK